MAKLRFIDHGENIIFLGPPGVGNTHLAVVLEMNAVEAGDRVIASAILDRRRHHSTTISMKGESARLKDKRRAGLIQPPTMLPEGGDAKA
jgi:DNA replication protein DnaC